MPTGRAGHASAAAAEPPGILAEMTLDALIRRARGLVVPGGRRLLGITGPPGAGKSTLAEALVRALAPDAVLVGMDGFHLSGDELHRRGLARRKGAPETFDAAAYVDLLRALRSPSADVVAPGFDRSVEETVPAAAVVGAAVPLVVTEGNYLLLDAPPWSSIADLLDECWYVDLRDDIRVGRLVERHAVFGKSRAEALAWAGGSDARNAELVAGTKGRASLIIDMSTVDLAPG
jgi:pantothenate kinase